MLRRLTPSVEAFYYLRFGISELDVHVSFDGGDFSGGIGTSFDTNYYVVNLSAADSRQRLKAAYEKIRVEFDSSCGYVEDQLHDAVTALYRAAPDWAEAGRDTEDLLFTWYPPDELTPARKDGRKNLAALQSEAELWFTGTPRDER